MKRILSLVVGVLCATLLISQDVPQGMKYQAVARDASGEILVEQEIMLKVSLQNQGAISEVYYVEEHAVTTNKLGQFALTIGGGKALSGEFSKIPWSTTDVWMQVAFARDEGDPYRVISDSRMLSVPYAFHAATATQLTAAQSELDDDNDDNEDDRTPDPGSDSNNWHTDGNTGTDPLTDFLGTTDTADLVIITNDIERIRVLEGGDVYVANSQRIGKNLEVRDSVWLNTQGGETRNFGPFTVDSMSPTLLSGTLTVDEASDLNSSLNVDGPTDLNSSLDVNNMSPTQLTGTLSVDGISTFNNTTTSTNKANGAVTVAGGVGIGENLNVGGDFDVRGSATFGGEATFESPVTISALDESTDVGNGALIVYGGMGLGKRLNVGGATALNSTLGVTGATMLNSTLSVAEAATLNGATQINNTLTVGPYATSLGGTLGVTGATSLASTLNVNNGSKTTLSGALDVSGITKLLNTTESTLTSDGSLVVSGGVGIAKKLNVGGAMKLENTFTVSTGGSFTPNNSTKNGTGHIALFENTTDGSGIVIKVNSGQPTNKNNFITFLDASNNVVGRIEGESTSGDLDNNREYQDDRDFLITDIALSATAEAITIVEEIQAIVEVTAAATSVTVCVGLGVCVTSPVPSFIVSSAANLIVQTANLILQTADLAKVTANLVVFEDTHEALLGITFASGAEDYAEYLPKLDPNEKFLKGDLVGMKNGFITKNTKGADRIMVVSHNPAMLGGLPINTEADLYEMIAFMGQVPTRIIGAAEPGDYILPSGYNNGFGIAKHPSKMTAEDYRNVLGVSWDKAEGMEMNIVNVAIGINTNVIADLVMQQAAKIEQQEKQLESLENQMSETEGILANLVPGFKEAAGVEGDFPGAPDVTGDEWSRALEIASQQTTAHEVHPHDRATDIIYYEVRDAEIEQAFTMLEELYAKHNVDLSDHPFWQRIKAEPSYKQEVIHDIKGQLSHAMHVHQEMNHKLNND